MGKYQDRKFLTFFIFLQFYYLVLGSLQYESLDWQIQWYSAKEITEGIGFYFQDNRLINGRYIWNANHPPVFFYSLALWMTIFGTSHLMSRVFMYFWVLFLQLIVLELLGAKETKDGYLALLLIFCNPYVHICIYLGLFDIFVLVYILLTIYLMNQDHPVLGSLSLSFAILSKTYPLILIVPITYYLIHQNKINATIILLIQTCLIVLATYFMYYTIFGEEFLQRVLFFQLERNHLSLSIWYFIFGFNPFEGFVYFQILILVIVGLFLWFLPYKLDKNQIYVGSTIILIVFINLLRTVYPHYMLWYSILLIPVMYDWILSGHLKRTVLVIFGILLNLFSLLTCVFGCFDDPTTSEIIRSIEILSHFLGDMLVLLTLVRYIITVRGDRNFLD